MKALIAILLTILAFEASAQPFWLIPVRIASGNGNDIHPTIADGNGWLSSGERELLAFSRNGKCIGILQSAPLGASWPDSITWITTDSADNDFPSLVRSRWFFSSVRAMLVWQGRRNNNLEILFSKLDQNGWSSPQPVAINSADDQNPHVGCHDSTFYVVWEEEGKVLFSQYSQSTWTVPLVVSSENDTLSHVPQVTILHLDEPPSYQPCVVWQRRMEPSQSFALMTSFRSNTGWSFPDTLVSGDDNRRPRFYKYGRQATLTWEKREGVLTTTYAGEISVLNGRVTLGSSATLNNLPDTALNCSVNGSTSGNPVSPLFVPYTAGAWELPGQDCVGVALRPDYMTYGRARLSASGAAINRSPTVSEGTGWIHLGWHLRIWVVWEALVNGVWQLYGSYAEEFIAGADELSGLSEQFALLQNYPNPFNPTTTIRYTIPGGANGRTFLRVYDLLGREIATLVDGVKQPGTYTVEWNAAGVASGVYFYRLESSGRMEFKRMIVLR